MARIACIVLLLLVFGGCRKENAFDCLKSTGPIRTETRQLAHFSQIEVEDNVEVVLVQDTVAWAEVEAGDNLLPHVRTEVKDGKLLIGNLNKCNWVRSYRKKMQVRLHVPQVQNLYIVHEGENIVRSEGVLTPDSLYIYQTAAGDFDLQVSVNRIWMNMFELGNVKLSGRTNLFNLYLRSLGSLEAEQLESVTCYTHISGSGNASLRATGMLGAHISGQGSLTYFGNPSGIDLKTSGTGKFIKGD